MAALFGNMADMLAYVFLALAFLCLIANMITATIMGVAPGATVADQDKSLMLYRANAWFHTATTPLCILAVAMVLNLRA